MKANLRADVFIIELQSFPHETEPQQAGGEVSTTSSQDTPGRSSNTEKIQNQKGIV
jgi:hypothetical protein